MPLPDSFSTNKAMSPLLPVRTRLVRSVAVLSCLPRMRRLPSGISTKPPFLLALLLVAHCRLLTMLAIVRSYAHPQVSDLCCCELPRTPIPRRWDNRAPTYAPDFDAERVRMDMAPVTPLPVTVVGPGIRQRV